jgi:uncharacterized lipoprotein YajG
MNRKTHLKKIACISALLLIAGCKGPQLPAVQRVVPVQVYKVQPDSISSYITLTGSVEVRMMLSFTASYPKSSSL